MRGLSQEVKASKLGRGSTNGVYRYDFSDGLWHMIEEGTEPLVPKERFAVIYFDNTLCPICRAYDESWYPFIGSYRDKLKELGIEPYIVLCDWFTQQCASVRAAMTFINYDVHASPTTLLVSTKDGKVTYVERYEGALTERDLVDVVLTFPERASKAESGATVERPLTQLDVLRKLEESLSSGKRQG